MRRFPCLTFWRVVFLAMLGAGVYSLAMRFLYGLGATIGMNDAYPWGLWIGFDVLCGVGLSAGAFAIAAMVYVFRLEKYRSILRATVLTAFLGYLMVIASLLCDLGLPYRIWHPLFMRNLHSPLFEVAMCVMFYTFVLALEFSPAVLERFGLQAPLRLLHSISLPLVIIGVLLSTLHQSSLGTLFLIVPNKLHGLWYSPLLPAFFFVSAIGAGLSMVIFESYMSHRAFGTSLHRDILQGLAKASAIVLLVGLTARLADLFVRGNIGLMMEGSLESRMFLLEIILGAALPIALYLSPRVRQSRTGLYLTAILVLCGFVLNRLNVSITGLQRHVGQVYFPTWMEVAITVFIVACGFKVFGLMVRYLPVFPSPGEVARHEAAYVPLQTVRGASRPMGTPIATPAGFAFLSGLAMVFALAAILEQSNAISPISLAPSQPDAVRMKAVSLRIAGKPLRVPENQHFTPSEMSPGPVVFRHATHVKGHRIACETCHADLFPMSRPASVGQGHTIEMMDKCRSCHNGEAAFEIRQGCGFCHSKQADSIIAAVTARQVAPPADFQFAGQRKSPGPVPFSHRRHLTHTNGECTTCHPTRFGMVSPQSGLLTMAAMRQGGGCGSCHNGRNAFTIASDCALCHRSGVTPPRQSVARVNRVPEDRVLRAVHSPGAVKFSHRSHLSHGAACVTCHHAVFPMTDSPALHMKVMKAGQQCGTCHNGRDAFTVAADCGLCHEPQTKPTLREKEDAVASSNEQLTPADYKFPTGKKSPGAVTFSHSKHLKVAQGRCTECHQTLFPMRRPEEGTSPMKKMLEGQQCGACHNGKRAFASDDDCSRCHAMGDEG